MGKKERKMKEKEERKRGGEKKRKIEKKRGKEDITSGPKARDGLQYPCPA